MANNPASVPRPQAVAVLNFDGVDDSVEIGARAEHKIPRDITIEAWVYVRAQKQWAGIVSRVYDTGYGESGYGLLLDGLSGVNFALKVPAAGINYLSSGADSLPLNGWHHVAATWDGRQAVLYIDGARKAGHDLVAGALEYTPDHPLRLGMYRDNDEAHGLDGKIAEVRLWGVARSQEAIQADMNRRLDGKDPGLVGYWPMHEGEGPTVHDATRSLQHGEVNGATWEQSEVPFHDREVPEEARPSKAFADELAAQAARIAALEQAIAKCGDCETKLAALQAELVKCGDCETKLVAITDRLAALEKRLGEPPTPAKPEPPQPAKSAKVVISHIHFLGTAKDAQADEFIEVRNIGEAAQDLSGWRIAAGERNLAFTFPAGTTLAPGASARVYTDLEAPGPGRFSFASNGRAIWNDKGSEGTLFDQRNTVVSKYGYRSHESRTVESIKAACGVPGLTVKFDPKVAAAQEKSRDRVDFLTAVERALRSLIEDPPGGVDSTAATIVRDAWDEAGPNPDDATLQRVIREHLNGKKILELLAEDSGELPEAPGVKTHWVFAVKADFNPPGHWVVVDRASAAPARQVF